MRQGIALGSQVGPTGPAGPGQRLTPLGEARLTPWYDDADHPGA
ncbi:hypothetical protein [Ornithinicoccus hortensis]|nr:hypothetical protein [Ornithinicoccus hortensis]